MTSHTPLRDQNIPGAAATKVGFTGLRALAGLDDDADQIRWATLDACDRIDTLARLTQPSTRSRTDLVDQQFTLISYALSSFDNGGRPAGLQSLAQNIREDMRQAGLRETFPVA
jgi:hypothetical protein